MDSHSFTKSVICSRRRSSRELDVLAYRCGPIGIAKGAWSGMRMYPIYIWEFNPQIKKWFPEMLIWTIREGGWNMCSHVRLQTTQWNVRMVEFNTSRSVITELSQTLRSFCQPESTRHNLSWHSLWITLHSVSYKFAFCWAEYAQEEVLSRRFASLCPSRTRVTLVHELVFESLQRLLCAEMRATLNHFSVSGQDVQSPIFDIALSEENRRTE
jgi:hypothetical protein